MTVSVIVVSAVRQIPRSTERICSNIITRVRIRDPDRHQNLITYFIAHCQPSLKISCKSVQKILRKVANRQPDRQTNKQRRLVLHNLLGGGLNSTETLSKWPIAVYCTLELVAVVDNSAAEAWRQKYTFCRQQPSIFCLIIVYNVHSVAWGEASICKIRQNETRTRTRSSNSLILVDSNAILVARLWLL